MKINEINIFYPSETYIKNYEVVPLNHLIYIYSKLKSKLNNSININEYPKNNKGLLKKIIFYTFKIRDNSLNILLPGHSFIYAFIAIYLFRKKAKYISLLWTIPGQYDEQKTTSKIYDFIIRKVIERSDIVFYISKIQRTQLENMIPVSKIKFMPVIADPDFWNTKYKNLNKFNFIENKFILIVGGNDRDEIETIKLSREMNILLVRVTRNNDIALSFENLCKDENFDNFIILKNITNDELKYLYNKAYIVFLPTKTKTNPAGLTSITEALSCNSIVVTNKVAQGYALKESKFLRTTWIEYKGCNYKNFQIIDENINNIINILNMDISNG